MRLKIAATAALAICFLTFPGLVLARGGGGHSSHTGFTGTGSNHSSHSVAGYVTERGTYVSPHHETDRNGSQRDNYGTRGNMNPYTGSVGTTYTPRY